jgi:hypothetical protein
MMTPTLYSLWLPITHFLKIAQNLEKENIDYNYQSNSDWNWLNFKYKDSLIVMDSLGYIYIESNEYNKKSIFELIAKILSIETIFTIKKTFLNPQIQSYNKALSILNFMENIYIEVSSYKNLKIEYVSAHLLIKNKKICSDNKIKFSVNREDNLNEETSFYHILNRNFCQLLNKSVYFTHGFEFEDGEIYNCLSLLTQERLEPLLESIQQSNISFKINNELNNDILLGVLKKAIQDTIEEKTVLHFLNITKNLYLNNILDKISTTNSSLNKLNSYLLATPNQNNFLYNPIKNHDFDEEDIEVFVQNLLSSIPKFHNIESKIKETYYIKVGNTTTSNRVEESETIGKTFFYSKWTASIQYFMETVNNIKESLNIYHQNKNLKELEDISYNANYQADIEDIRDLKNDENTLLNDSTKNYISLILFIFAIITLVGEAPLYKNIIPIYKEPFFLKIVSIIGTNLLQHTINIFLYSLLFFLLFYPFIKKYFKTKPNKKGIYNFEDSDYDKHEHRSNKSLYTLKDGKNIKVTVGYNDVISAYSLMKQLKVKEITKPIGDSLNSFSIFPKLLQKTPIDIDYTYRENYRISRNDKVTTKIMFRYKITKISLKEFIQLLNEDDFVNYYISYISKENIDKKDFSKERLIKSLKIENWNSDEVKLNLYVVYSFILKLNKISQNNCDYSIVKDQFRVHYHINKLYYEKQEDLEEQQECLAQLVYIYFLARLKKFA